jgi:hypothetical protein
MRATEKIRPLLGALLRDTQFEEETIGRIEKISVAEGRDTDKTDAIWGFDLLEHLIQCSNNRMHADGTKIGWI